MQVTLSLEPFVREVWRVYGRHEKATASSINIAGVKFFTGENIWDTRGPGGLAALRPLALLGQAGPCPTSTRFRRQKNKRTDKQKDDALHKASVLRRGLNDWTGPDGAA